MCDTLDNKNVFLATRKQPLAIVMSTALALKNNYTIIASTVIDGYPETSERMLALALITCVTPDVLK